jgi:hypothetical protein
MKKLYSSELIAVANSERVTINGQVLLQIEILPAERLTLVVLGKLVASDELALRYARVLHRVLVHLHGVVLEVVQDGDGSHAIELVRALVHGLLEVAVEAEHLLVVGHYGRHEVVRRLGLRAAVNERGLVVGQQCQLGLVELVVEEAIATCAVLIIEIYLL